VPFVVKLAKDKKISGHERVKVDWTELSGAPHGTDILTQTPENVSDLLQSKEKRSFLFKCRTARPPVVPVLTPNLPIAARQEYNYPQLKSIFTVDLTQVSLRSMLIILIGAMIVNQMIGILRQMLI